MEGLGLDIHTIYAYLLLLVRVACILLLAPVLGGRSLPWMVRIHLVLVVSLVLLPGVDVSEAAPFSGLMAMTGDVARELMVGMTLGSLSMLLFASVEMAGTLVGYQMGFAIVNVLDPQSETQVAVLAQFKYLLAAALFLALDGHHLVVEALQRSLELVPLGGAHASRTLALALSQKAGAMFVTGLQLGAPAVISLLAVTVALGLVARAVPQMNVFIVGMPLQIVVGLGTVAVALPVFYAAISRAYAGMGGDFRLLLRLLARA